MNGIPPWSEPKLALFGIPSMELKLVLALNGIWHPSGRAEGTPPPTLEPILKDPPSDPKLAFNGMPPNCGTLPMDMLDPKELLWGSGAGTNPAAAFAAAFAAAVAAAAATAAAA